MGIENTTARRVAFAIMAAGVALATPAAATTEMLGGGFMVSRWGGCEDYGWVGTQQVLARMEPQGAPGNLANESQLSLLLSTGTIAIRYNNEGGYRRNQEITQATYVWNGPWTPDEPSMTLSWDLYGEIPEARDSALDQLVINFQNFNEHPGCRMSVFLVMQRN
ncbi:hypothetical protein [Pararhodobacter zhoushanensis]|uniref:hypothetical protein n=1 Tax=Pararhodobacter zhoushanensis TaxID=2479545 RepID=UPI000F8F56E7|nr:hypothetical protein [Pararhodobacter zhoushanensis]